MIRIGVLGTASTHVDAFLRHFADGEARITAALAEGTERDDQLRAAGVQIHQEIDGVLAAVDAVIVAHRDGDRHHALALPGLRRGLPTLIDKPLATSLADAHRLARLAGTTPVATGSVLQWHPVVQRLAATPTQRLEATGPADPRDPNAGIFFYGIHPAEAACAAAGGGAFTLGDIHRSGGSTTITGQVGATEVRVTLIDAAPGDHGFTLTADGVTHELGLGEDYLRPVSSAFRETLRDGRSRGVDAAVAAVALLASAR